MYNYIYMYIYTILSILTVYMYIEDFGLYTLLFSGGSAGSRIVWIQLLVFATCFLLQGCLMGTQQASLW